MAVIVALVLSSFLAKITTPIRHSLLTSSASWLVILLYTFLRGDKPGKETNKRRKILALRAGLFLGIGQVCSRAAADKEGLWWITSLLPIAIVIESQFRVRAEHDDFPSSNLSRSERNSWNGSTHLLFLAAAIASIALNVPFITTSSLVLCFCSVLFSCYAYLSVDDAAETTDGTITPTSGHITLGGDSVKNEHFYTESSANRAALLRLIASIMFVVCGFGAIVLESSTSEATTWTRKIVLEEGTIWSTIQTNTVLYQCVVSVSVQAVENMMWFEAMIRLRAVKSSLLSLAACMLAKIVTNSSPLSLTLTTIFMLFCLHVVSDEAMGVSLASLLKTSKKRTIALLIIGSLTFCSLLVLTHGQSHFGTLKGYSLGKSQESLEFDKPISTLNSEIHPVAQVVHAAEDEFGAQMNNQSQTLEQAVAEYRRRYHQHPPPHFDKWFQFAQRKGVKLIDEFDAMYHTLLPFWSLSPSTIRLRTREALGNVENQLMALTIRNGRAVLLEGGEGWQQEATMGMIKEFIEYLPDMDLAFNVHDEPRIVVPHDKLSKMVAKAQSEILPKAFENRSPKDSYSPPPEDLGNGRRIEETKRTRFNQFAHQETWTHSRLSCSPDSPARDYEEDYHDNTSPHAFSDLGFIYNLTAYMDVCDLPSLSDSLGFFVQPNAYSIAQDLIPIFSQSKISSYQDILYPSPWYWAGNVTYETRRDMDWAEKAETLYWRGSTTGGYSRNGIWRKLHRQRMVQALNALDDATILSRDAAPDADSPRSWQPQTVPRAAYKSHFDVHFSLVQQCDEHDYSAQVEFFNVSETAERSEAFAHRHLLDIDGNAFSGRFYAFLESQSLVYKASVFREWHADRLKPWVHYVPASLKGNEILELVRYFAEEDEGRDIAKRLAGQGREWARSALRKEDMEVWFFRLLLEYGRLVDDNREELGFVGS